MFEKYFDLNALNGTNGFTVVGFNASLLGHSVAAIGDINLDGIDDVAIGSPTVNSCQGAVYVIFGQKNFTKTFDLKILNGENGFTIPGLQSGNCADGSGDRLGVRVSGAGDVNGDGKADLLLGAFGANNFRGAVYVIFGQINFPAIFDLNNLKGENGFKVIGKANFDRLGFSVSSAGDMNGDGMDEILIDAMSFNNWMGASYIIFGNKTFPENFNLLSLNGNNGFEVTGLNVNDCLGWSVSTAGDLNDDGRSDIVLGSLYANQCRGASYIIFGQQQFLGKFDLATLNGTNGFMVEGITGGTCPTQAGKFPGDRLGASVSATKDINGDGRSDLILGAPYAGEIRGTSYVVFGQGNPFPKRVDLLNLTGANGFSIPGLNPSDALYIVNTAGDLNGDGRIDMVFGAPGVNNNTGSGYIIFGQNREFLPIFNLTLLNGMNGFEVPGIIPSGELGLAVSTAGDLNDDGISDLILGAPIANNQQGVSYIIFGKSPLRLINNQLAITQNQSVIFDSENLKAIDLNDNAPQNSLIFNIDTLKGGWFEFINKSAPIASFLQQNILDNQIRFVQDGSNTTLSYSVSISNGFVNTTPSSANVTFSLAPPKLVNNQISIKQGEITVLTLDNLSATDLNYPAGTLIFSVNNPEGGQFERVSRPGVSIKEFSQQEVMDQQIQFASDKNSKGAGYTVVVTDGNHLSTMPSKANVTFIARPILWQNQLFIKQGSAVVLDRTNINATDDDTPDSGLVITASNVKHGQFEYNDQPDIAIDHFTQENITQSAVRFKTDGGYEKPSYDLTVKDESDLTDGPKAANITFHDAPRLVNNQLTIREGQTVNLSRSDLSATERYTPEAELEFEISNIQHGSFQWRNNSNKAKPSLAITKFFQKNITDKQVQFAHDGSAEAPSYAVTVSDGELNSGTPKNASINFHDNTPVDNGLKIGLSIAGVAAGMAALGLLAYRQYKKQPVILPGPTEDEKLIVGAEPQSGSRSCQLF